MSAHATLSASQPHAVFTYIVLKMDRLGSKVHGQYSQEASSAAKVQNTFAAEVDSLAYQKICQVSGALPDLEATCQHISFLTCINVCGIIEIIPSSGI
jgi:hypothetical protein